MSSLYFPRRRQYASKSKMAGVFTFINSYMKKNKFLNLPRRRHNASNPKWRVGLHYKIITS
jgi:hypothetical protein